MPDALQTQHVETFWARTVPHATRAMLRSTPTQWCGNKHPRRISDWVTRSGSVYASEWSFSSPSAMAAAWVDFALELIGDTRTWSLDVMMETTPANAIVLYATQKSVAWYLSRCIFAGHPRRRLPALPCKRHVEVISPIPQLVSDRRRITLSNVIMYAATATFMARQILSPETMPHLSFHSGATKRTVHRTGSRLETTVKLNLEKRPSLSCDEFCHEEKQTDEALAAWHLVYSAFFSMHHNAILFHTLAGLLAINEPGSEVYLDHTSNVKIKTADLLQSMHADRFNPLHVPMRLMTTSGNVISTINAHAMTWYLELKDDTNKVHIVDMNAFGGGCILGSVGVLEYAEAFWQTFERICRDVRLTREQFLERYGPKSRRMCIIGYGKWAFENAPPAYRSFARCCIASSEDSQRRMVQVCSMPGAGTWTSKGILDLSRERHSMTHWMEMARALSLQFSLNHASNYMSFVD